MDDFVVAFTGVILQVLGLVLSFGTFVLGVIELVLKLASKIRPGRPLRTNRSCTNSPNRRSKFESRRE
ncbi:hypothetical protein [Gordonibacter sp.]|uniref:hypothetical protein n=1 Tax=Gordonibacter sp. TaxID=1968902 RepID=UPI002FCA8EBA